VVVRATAIGPAPAPSAELAHVRFFSFAVVEVLKGTPPGDTLVFMGAADNRDSFREGEDAAVPYLSYHRWYAGDCIASMYRPGAEYLLLLRHWGARGENFDPYWQMLAPTNEQIRGADDPWVAWVRTTLADGG
jgi:hypothetical protein